MLEEVSSMALKGRPTQKQTRDPGQRPDEDSDNARPHQPPLREIENHARPEEVELLLDRQRPEMRSDGEFAVDGEHHVLKVGNEPENVPSHVRMHEEQRKDERIVDGEDPQESANVEVLQRPSSAVRCGLQLFTGTQQDARDQKAAQHKEQPDADPAPLHELQPTHSRFATHSRVSGSARSSHTGWRFPGGRPAGSYAPQWPVEAASCRHPNSCDTPLGEGGHHLSVES